MNAQFIKQLAHSSELVIFKKANHEKYSSCVYLATKFDTKRSFGGGAVIFWGGGAVIP